MLYKRLFSIPKVHIFEEKFIHMSKPIFIAGPCVIESSSVMHEIAEVLCGLNDKYGIDIVFKASFDKANRTSFNSYRGPGLDRGLVALADMKSEYGLKLLTDIHESWQAEPVSEVVDIIQIPAFLCRQTDLIISAGNTGRTVNIKKGQFMSADDMKHVADKVRTTPSPEIWMTERGSCFGYNDLVVDFRNITWMKKYADKVIMDCTHSVQRPNGNKGTSSGVPEFIPAMASAAKAFGADGYFFEVHPDPGKALSDGANMLGLDKLESIIVNIL